MDVGRRSVAQKNRLRRRRLRPLLLVCLTLPRLAAAQTTVTYVEDAEDFVNPERGFYRYSETRESSHTPLDEATLRGFRELHTPFGAAYSVYSSVVFRYFILDDSVDAGLASETLDQIAADFDTARLAGVKLIPRFVYTVTPMPGSCSEVSICPPYGDAAKARVLSHIDALGPVLEQGSDVIAAVQLGFIGIWGENYYTDYFGDPSPNSVTPFLSGADWTERKEVLERLLRVVPPTRMVQVRYPQKKQKYLYGNATGTSAAESPPITIAEAHNGSDIARVGHHNDCLLAGPDDFGTYFNYDPPATSDVTNLKSYLAEETRYVVVGGETCSDGYSPTNDCVIDGGTAETELAALHYSYLNADYNHDVNNDWVGSCMEEVKKGLGYRLALRSGTYSDEVQPGQLLSLSIELGNEGFAAPFNPRGVEVVLRSAATGEKWFARLPDDPRLWLDGGAAHAIDGALCVPPSVPPDSYELLLNLPDPSASIYDRPEYSIRLASRLPGDLPSWEAASGYNKLGHSVLVNAVATNPECSGEIGFLASSAFSGACVDDLEIAGVAVPTGNYQARGVLSVSDSAIGGGSTVLLQSDTLLRFESGFSVAENAELAVALAPCE